MAEQEGQTLAELRDSGRLIPARPQADPADMVMGIGQDPAKMDIEVRDSTPFVPDDKGPIDTSRLAEVPVVDEDDTTRIDTGPATAPLPTESEIDEIVGAPTERLDVAVEFSESEDGEMLVVPIGGQNYEVAKSLPQRRYQKLLVMFQEMQQIRTGKQLTDMNAEELEVSLGTFENMLRLVMEDDEFARLETRMDSLRNPVGPIELNPVVGALLRRYMQGVGAAAGKPQG